MTKTYSTANMTNPDIVDQGTVDILDQGPFAGSVDRVLLAAPRSFCAGVEMAIKALAWMVRLLDPPIYCYHEIVHNRVVVDRFRRAGVVFVDDIEDVPAGAPLMLSAHGSAPEVVQAARDRSAVVVDAVCPLVNKVHHEVRRRSEAGETVIYAGHRTHDETVGTLAVAPGSTHLVEEPADVAALDGVDGPVALLAQTTLALRDWQGILTAARERFGDVWIPGRSDLCYATTNRQAAVEAVAPQCDSVVVIGSVTSSNTRALAQVARAAGARRVLQINNPDELPPDLWGTVGVTAGASAPEDVVESVLHRLAPAHGVEVVETAAENEYFPPPRELRDLVRSVADERLLEGDRSVCADDILREIDGGRPAPVPQAADLRTTQPGDAWQVGTRSGEVDDQMAQLIEEEVAEPWLRQVLGYHLGWLDESFEPRLPAGTRPGGKKIRAALAVLSGRAAAASATEASTAERVVPFAAAIELVHNWSLVHDDIEDGDALRRGRPSLWALCGVPQALNAGNCLYGLAFRALGRLREGEASEAEVAELTTEVARAAVELTVGQMRDIALDAAITPRGYLEMVEGKTGAVMRCAAYGGALLGSGDRAVAEAFGEFGLQLGLGFQIRDDILGVWGTEAETGKPVGGDIRRRKRTLPVVVALEQAKPPDRQRLGQIYAQGAALSPSDELDARLILDRCGAREVAQEQARQHRRAAVAALARATGTTDPSRSTPHAALQALADFVTERTH